MTLSRRRVLALNATLLSAGCSSTNLVGSDDCTAGFHVSGERFDPATDLTVELDRDERAIVAEAIEAGSAERTTYGEAPLKANRFLTREGAFYETDFSIAETEDVTAYRLNVEWERDQQAPGDETPLNFADLPDADRMALELAVYGGEEREQLPKESLRINDFPAPYPNGAESSALVGEGVQWVRWNDRTYRIDVGGSTTQERRTFRYEVERVATSADEFRSVAASRYRIDLGSLPDETKTIVSRALEDRYEECSPASESLQELRDRLPDDRRLPNPHDGWYVRFDGGDYRLSILQWVE